VIPQASSDLNVSFQVGQLQHRRRRTTLEVRLGILATTNPSASSVVGVCQQPGFHRCRTAASHCATQLPLASQLFNPFSQPNTDAVAVAFAFTFTSTFTDSVAYGQSLTRRKHTTAGKRVLH
jgi:hypothetical protein